MSYTKRTWQTGETITAAKLNQLEAGLEAAADAADGAATAAALAEGLSGAVQVAAQTFTDAQQAQARGNIGAASASALAALGDGAVQVSAQTFTDAQRAQARGNIGAADAAAVDALGALITAICPAVSVGPDAVIHVTDAMPLAPEALTVAIAPSQPGGGEPSPTNVRPIAGWTGANLYHGAFEGDPEARAHAFAFPAQAGTVYGGALDALSGVLTVTHAALVVDGSAAAFYLGSGGTQFRVMTEEFKQGIQGTRAVSNWLPSTVLRINSNVGFLYGYVSDHAALGFDSAEALNAKCAEMPLVVVYELASPVTWQLAPAQLTMHSGGNALWAEGGEVALTYRANPYDRLLARIDGHHPAQAAALQSAGPAALSGAMIAREDAAAAEEAPAAETEAEITEMAENAETADVTEEGGEA